MPTYIFGVSRAAQSDWTAIEFADGETLNIEVQRSAEVVGALVIVFAPEPAGTGQVPDYLLQKAFTGDTVTLRKADMAALAEGGSWFADIVEIDGADQYRVRKGTATKLPSIAIDFSPTATAPAFTVNPAITGTLEVGATLTVSDGTTTGTLPITFTYAWSRGGITTKTYLLGAGDAGQAAPSCTVTAANGTLPNATATAPSIGTVPAAATAPAQFGTGAWSLADSPSAGGNTLTLTIITLPADGGSAITALQYSVGGGAAQTLSGTGTGARDITVPASTLASVTVWAVNSVGAGTASAAKTATPTSTLTAPVFTTQPTITPASGPVGTVFTINEGVATGNPSPTLAVTTFTQAGVDVSGDLVGDEFTSTADGALALAVTATNSQGSAVSTTATATVTVTPAAIPFSGTTRTAPDAGAGTVANAEFSGPNYIRTASGDVYGALFAATKDPASGALFIKHVVSSTGTFEPDYTIGAVQKNNHAMPAMFLDQDTGRAVVIYTQHNLNTIYRSFQQVAGTFTGAGAWSTPQEFASEIDPATNSPLTYAGLAYHFGETPKRVHLMFRVGDGPTGRSYFSTSTNGGATFNTGVLICESAQRNYFLSSTNASGTESTVAMALHPTDPSGNAGSPVKGFRVSGGVIRQLDGTAFTLGADFSTLQTILDEGVLPTWPMSGMYDGTDAHFAISVYEATAPLGGDITIKRATVNAAGVATKETVANIGPSTAVANSVTTAVAIRKDTPDVVYANVKDAAIGSANYLCSFQRLSDGSGWQRTPIRESETGLVGIRHLANSGDQPDIFLGIKPGVYGGYVTDASDTEPFEFAYSGIVVGGLATAITPAPANFTPTVSTAAQTVLDLFPASEALIVSDPLQSASLFDDANQRAIAVGERVGTVRNLMAVGDPILNAVSSFNRPYLASLTQGPTRVAGGVALDGAAYSYLEGYARTHGPNWYFSAIVTPAAVSATKEMVYGGDTGNGSLRVFQMRYSQDGLEVVAFDNAGANYNVTASKTLVNGRSYLMRGQVSGTTVTAYVEDLTDDTNVTGTTTMATTGRAATVTAAIGARLSSVGGADRAQMTVGRFTYHPTNAIAANVAEVEEYVRGGPAPARPVQITSFAITEGTGATTLIASHAGTLHIAINTTALDQAGVLGSGADLKVTQAVDQGSESITIDLSSLAAGTYFVQAVLVATEGTSAVAAPDPSTITYAPQVSAEELLAPVANSTGLYPQQTFDASSYVTGNKLYAVVAGPWNNDFTDPTFLVTIDGVNGVLVDDNSTNGELSGALYEFTLTSNGTAASTLDIAKSGEANMRCTAAVFGVKGGGAKTLAPQTTGFVFGASPATTSVARTVTATAPAGENLAVAFALGDRNGNDSGAWTGTTMLTEDYGGPFALSISSAQNVPAGAFPVTFEMSGVGDQQFRLFMVIFGAA